MEGWWNRTPVCVCQELGNQNLIWGNTLTFGNFGAGHIPGKIPETLQNSALGEGGSTLFLNLLSLQAQNVLGAPPPHQHRAARPAERGLQVAWRGTVLA